MERCHGEERVHLQTPGERRPRPVATDNREDLNKQESGAITPPPQHTVGHCCGAEETPHSRPLRNCRGCFQAPTPPHRPVASQLSCTSPLRGAGAEAEAAERRIRFLGNTTAALDVASIRKGRARPTRGEDNESRGVTMCQRCFRFSLFSFLLQRSGTVLLGAAENSPPSPGSVPNRPECGRSKYKSNRRVKQEVTAPPPRSPHARRPYKKEEASQR